MELLRRSQPMIKKQNLLLISLTLISTGCAAATGPLGISILSAVIISLAVFSSACDNDKKKDTPYPRIFITANTSNGHLGTEGGTRGADEMCNNTDDGNHPGDSAIFKALIASAETSYERNLTTDWALKASTEYKRLNGTVIGTTDTAAKFTSPLDNYMAASDVDVWTGLNDDFTAAVSNCYSWNTTSSDVYGNYGNTGQLDSRAWDSDYKGCIALQPLICVEQ